MKRYFFLFVLILLIQVGNAQNRIIQSSNNMNAIDNKIKIEKIKLPWGFWGRNLRIVVNNGKDSLIKRRSIWGFQRNGGPVKRFWDVRPYDIVEMGEVIIYKVKGKATSYYFSSDLDSKINPLTHRRLIKALSKEKYELAIQSSRLLRRLVG